MLSKKDINTFSELLRVYEKRSTCKRLQVAALLIKNNRVVSTGWNGVPSGKEHCENVFNSKDVDVEHNEEHRQFSEAYEIHAEAGCIGYAARYGIETLGCEMVQSVSPCTSCAKLIIASGITAIYYRDVYDRSGNQGISLLESCGIRCYQFNED